MDAAPSEAPQCDKFAEYCNCVRQWVLIWQVLQAL